MSTNDEPSARERGQVVLDTRMLRYLLLLFFAVIVIVLLVASMGLNRIFQDLVLREAEKDAVRLSTVLCDSEVLRFLRTSIAAGESLSIEPEELAEFDQQMRSYLIPFNIVKIKVFSSDTRIVYSTDKNIAGMLDKENAKLAIALSGSPVSKYKKKGQVKDLAEEERFRVDIVETYVPIKEPGGKIIGSFEIYKDVTPDLAMARNALMWAEGVTLVVVIAVFILLAATLQLVSRRS